ncbi:MAG: hypothetical protein IKT38_05045 [Clostridia bacterium]|nr:hypothetical protein [Clostridia bacterium]
MKKILKKSLACMLAAILCLTACVGAMASVSAEDAITYTIDDVAINQGGSDTINVTISNFADVAGLIAEITLPDAVDSIGDVKLNNTAELVKMTDDEPGHYVLNGKTIKFVGLFNSLDEFKLGDVVNTLTINIDVTVVDEAREAAPITAVFAAGDFNEGTLAVNGTDGTLTVKAVCKHEDVTTVKENEVAATCYAEGSYDEVVKCSCGHVVSSTHKTIAKIAHTPAEAVVENNVDATCYAEGSYDSVVYCSVEACKAEISRTPVTVEKTEHTPAEAVVENNVDATCYKEGSYDSVVYCSVEACKHEISRTNVPVEKIAHTPAEAVEENRVEAQPGVAGSYDSVVYCSVVGCGAEISRTPNEIPALPVEPEGPVVDSNLVFYRTSLAYGNSSLEFNFRIATTVLDLYNNVEVVIVPQKYDMTTLNLVENPAEIVIAKADLAAAGSKYKQYTYTDIQLYELGLNIDYMLRAYDANGELVAVSETFKTSIAKLLADNAADQTKSAAYRTLCVDTLVVCDEVMKNVAKSYEDSDLADAVAAGSVLDGVDTSIATQTIEECNTVNEFVSYDPEFLQETSTHQIRSSVAIGKVPYINFRVKDQKNAFDLNKLEVNVKYTSKDSAGEHPYNKTFSGSALTDGTFINCTFDEVGFHDSDKDILFTVSYDGEKKCEWTYSIETYLDGLKDSTNTGAQMTALIKLGQSFRTYQGL